MPELFPYHIFISHAWKYGDEYDRIFNLLNAAPYFRCYNYSAPSEKPLQNLNSTDVKTKKEIQDAIDRKIRPCSCVLVLSGMYSIYHDWMVYEISAAQKLGKPIIAIRPWGNKVMPNEVSSVAVETVGWNTDSIVSAIRRHS